MRPKYFNDAHLAVTIFKSYQSLFNELKKLNAYDEIFKSYEKYDQNKDEHLPGLIFNNKQMYWITLTHLRCYKKKKSANIKDVSGFESPYNESRVAMQRTFGCDIFPGFENFFLNDEPFLEFINEKTLDDLGMKIKV